MPFAHADVKVAGLQAHYPALGPVVPTGRFWQSGRSTCREFATGVLPALARILKESFAAGLQAASWVSGIAVAIGEGDPATVSGAG